MFAKVILTDTDKVLTVSTADLTPSWNACTLMCEHAQSYPILRPHRL